MSHGKSENASWVVCSGKRCFEKAMTKAERQRAIRGETFLRACLRNCTNIVSLGHNTLEGTALATLLRCLFYPLQNLISTRTSFIGDGRVETVFGPRIGHVTVLRRDVRPRVPSGNRLLQVLTCSLGLTPRPFPPSVAARAWRPRDADMTRFLQFDFECEDHCQTYFGKRGRQISKHSIHKPHFPGG